MPPLASARPTIVVKGQDSAALTAGLLALTIVESTEGSHGCEAVFGNWGTPAAGQAGFLYFDRQLLDFGVSFLVRPPNSRSVSFDGSIVALGAGFPRDSPPTTTVRAEDRCIDLRMTPRTRTFEGVSDSDVMNRIASDHGLTPVIDVTGGQHKILAQVNQSDLAFLRDRARAVDADIWIDGDALHAHTRARRQDATVALALGGALREFSVVADLTHQRTAVVVGGWDVQRKEAIESVATDAVLAREIGDRVSGPALLASHFGSREESVVHTVPTSRDEGRARAESCFRTNARGFVVGRGVADDGEWRIRAGAHLDLTGVGPLFSGPYYVTESCRIFDAQSGMRTEFTAQTTGLGRG